MSSALVNSLRRFNPSSSGSKLTTSLGGLPHRPRAQRLRSGRATERAVHAKTSFHHGITHISYEGNTFGLKFNNTGVRVMVDPWLVGDLTFADQDWLYRGKKRSVKVDLPQIAAETDVIVLSQYLDDHTHMPTLEALPKNIPVVANPEAADRIAHLGFESVTRLDHGQTVEVAGGKLKITGVPGALVGPPWSKRQNALIFRENAEMTPDGNSASLFYEPHCDFVDVVISPFKSTLIGVGGSSPLTRECTGLPADLVDVVISPVKSTLMVFGGMCLALIELLPRADLCD
eukprot:gene30459-35469_t